MDHVETQSDAISLSDDVDRGCEYLVNLIPTQPRALTLLLWR